MSLHRSPKAPPAPGLLALVAILALAPGEALAQADRDGMLSAPPLVQATEDPDDLDVDPLPSAGDRVGDRAEDARIAGPGPDAPVSRGEELLRVAPEAVTRTLRDAGLRPPSPRLRELRAELAALPTDVPASAATWIGQIMTEFALTSLAYGTFGLLTTPYGNERDGYVLLTLTTVLVLPVGAVTWAIGAIVDGHRTRSLSKRRHHLIAELRREAAFDPSW